MVSVIMSVYNEKEEYLHASIQSILNQTLSDLEFIIVNDNPNNTMIKKVLDKYKKSDDRVKVITNDRNIGLPRSLNEGLKYASGEYVARMDADDISDVNRLKKQLEYLNTHNLDLIGAELRRISSVGEIVDIRTNKSYSPNKISKLLRYDDCVAHPSWFAKRIIFIELCGYRNFYCCEDYDFLLRALEKKKRIGICDDVLLSYRINIEGISRKNSLRQMLSSQYLNSKYGSLTNVNEIDLNRFVEKNLLQKDCEDYEKALVMMNSGIKDLKKYKISGLIKIIESTRTSNYAKSNVKRIIRMLSIKVLGI